MRKRRRAKAAVYCGGGVGVCAVRLGGIEVREQTGVTSYLLYYVNYCTPRSACGLDCISVFIQCSKCMIAASAAHTRACRALRIRGDRARGAARAMPRVPRAPRVRRPARGGGAWNEVLVVALFLIDCGVCTTEWRGGAGGKG